MEVVVIVVVALAVGLGAVAALLFVLLRVLSRASADKGEQVRRAFPDAVAGPELGQYRGGTGGFPRTRNTSWIVLTPHALAVRPIWGTAISLPVADITGTRVQNSFNTYRNGQPVLVVETATGELGLTVADPAAWELALAR
ncbi:hypothetical protein [Nocardioides stalactiti]|uniref:hypothetical protein n=1 Tax=Nocardioides stalactiti TaxID=2755356 RepID=UPI00160032C7|nr:hypothetical protein [Nocardioides stalactiti]